MPVKTVSVTTSEQVLVEANEKRTVLAIANADADHICYISDEQGGGTNGFPLFTKSYLSLDRREGFEPEKKYYITGADTLTAHVLEQFQKFKEPEPEDDIQEPGEPDPRM